MTENVTKNASPSWMSDARLRRAIAGQIRQRRAKRKRELAKLESAIRSATPALPTEA